MKYTVTSLVRYLKNKLELDDNLRSLTVTGEISNFSRSSSGHLYFLLKDQSAAISCVMFSSKASTVKFSPKNGDKVIVSANTSLYEASGQLQLYVNSLKLEGIGDLFQQFEELKNKLAEEGIFSELHKKEFNITYPNNVAVLVGKDSAAMSDIKTCFNRRWPLAKVDYYPCIVQGNEAPQDIINNLLYVDSLNYDYIILARGGGSFEDLFCFNNEQLIRTIYNLNTLIVTGVGHEQDYTLVDFVSDLRAPTPTAAVELTTPDIKDVIIEIDNLRSDIENILTSKYEFYKSALDSLSNNKYLINPLNIVENKKLRLENLSTKLKQTENIYKACSNSIVVLNDKINTLINYRIKNQKSIVNNYLQLLNVYSVDNTLNRGYSLIYKDDRIIKNSKKLNPNDDIQIRFCDKKVNATVKEN